MHFADTRTMRGIPLLLVAVLAAGCDDITGAGAGALQFVVHTAGAAPDADGYALRIGSLKERTLGATDSIVIADLPSGPTPVTLSGVAANCTVTGPAARSVNVRAGETTRIAFDVTCPATSGSMRIAFSTSGLDLDPDGYDVTVRGTPVGRVAIDGAVVLADLPPGDHEIQISGLSGNCHIKEGTRQTFPVRAGAETYRPVVVRCGYLLTGGFRLVILSLDGSHFEDIAPQSEFVLYYRPAWSPDGDRVVFTTYVEPEPGIHVIDVGGAGLTRLTTGLRDAEPAWSPDGTRIAFDRDGAVWIMNADGSDQHALAGDIPEVDGDGATWSPDGRFIAHSCSNGAICVIPVDGSERRTLTGGDPSNFSIDPAWSPDGQRIVLSQWVEPSQRRLFLVNADGTGLRQITSGGSDIVDLRPRWSLSGEEIIFYRFTSGPGAASRIHWLRLNDPATVFNTPLVNTDMGALQPR